METNIKEARSGTDQSNIQEIIDAGVSAKHATLVGQAQYETPVEMSEFLNSLLPGKPDVMFDPQCASGRTFKGAPYWSGLFGFEIDNRHAEIADGITRVIGNCVSAWEILDDLYPDLKLECQVANPPFGLIWPVKDIGNVDSTEYTWMKIMERASSTGYGWFMANVKTIERLNLHQNTKTYLYQKFPPGLWKGTEVEIGVIHWDASNARPGRVELQYGAIDYKEHSNWTDKIIRHYEEFDFTRRTNPDQSDVSEAFDTVKRVLLEERKSRPKFNVWLDNHGNLRMYLSVRTKVKRKLERDEILRLSRIDKCHPLTLTPDRESRKLLAELLECGLYTIEPAARKAMEEAIAESVRMSRPIMPVTTFETVAYAEEEDFLLCTKDKFGSDGKLIFKAGKKYEVNATAYSFTDKFKRNKPHWSEKENKMITMQHDCELSGVDRKIDILGEDGYSYSYMDRPWTHCCFPESELWDNFQMPVVLTIQESHPEVVAKNKLVLATCEMLADFTYYPGQIDYLARIGAKSYGIVAGATGTGKSLFTISLIQMKGPKRALIIAPQGTLRTSETDEDEEDDEDDYKASQWLEELTRFARGVPVFQLFGFEDYEEILRVNNGTLPNGIYVTYYEAFFKNGALERCPDTWTDVKYFDECERRYGLDTRMESPALAGDSLKYWSRTVGLEKDGIRCICQPCLSTLIGHHFDMVCVDEGHIVNNDAALVTQMLIRLQPAYRYVFTATPITNVVTNLFALMGWICVPDWYKGGLLNAAWPFKRNELGKFQGMFMTTERDRTQENLNEEQARKEKKRYKGRVERASPVISAPARLLKLVKSSMAYISKSMCNPLYREPKFVDVRVPMGVEQTKLYAHFLNRGNIDGASALTRARKQNIYLRNICADPAGFTHGGPKVSCNFNPKTMTVLELIRDIARKGDPFVFISARKGMTDTIHVCLRDAGMLVSRVDSTVKAEQHSYQAHLFKTGKTQGMLMGIKCASSHSFSECPYEIIGSLEYSPGPLNQATGRIDRVNSKYDRTIYCVLNRHSIEELQYDVVATKDDAATICLQGRRVPRDFKPVDASEILADAILKFTDKDAVEESACESRWKDIRDSIAATTIKG